MMKFASCVAIAALLTSPARAGYDPTNDAWTDGGTSLNAAQLSQAFGKRQPVNGDISGQHATPSGAINSYLQSDLLRQLHFVPDWFKTAADGADDAPSIGRADAAACAAKTNKVEFLGRHYAANSPVPPAPCAVFWDGRSWQEEVTSTQALLTGTWLDIGAAFAGSAVSPVTFTGVQASGSRIEHFGFTEPGQTAPPITVTNASGQVTGYSPSTWAPMPYPPVINIDTVNGGVSVQHIMLAGVYDGINAHLAGRSEFNDIRGQVFHHGVTTDKSFDASKSDNWHFWPFWSSADPVMAYQQANMVGWLTGRNDTPMVGRIFVFGALAGIEIEGTAAESASVVGGSTTGMSLDQLQCDFVKYCLWVDPTASGVAFQIGMMRSYSQKWDTVYGDPVVMLPGSAPVQMDGYGIGQIGSAVSFGSDQSIFKYANTHFGSNIQLGSLYAVLTHMSANSNIVTWPTTGSVSSLLTLSMPPMLTPDAPSGFADTNYTSGGVGTLQWPAVQTIH